VLVKKNGRNVKKQKNTFHNKKNKEKVFKCGITSIALDYGSYNKTNFKFTQGKNKYSLSQ